MVSNLGSQESRPGTPSRQSKRPGTCGLLGFARPSLGTRAPTARLPHLVLKISFDRHVCTRVIQAKQDGSNNQACIRSGWRGLHRPPMRLSGRPSRAEAAALCPISISPNIKPIRKLLPHPYDLLCTQSAMPPRESNMPIPVSAAQLARHPRERENGGPQTSTDDLAFHPPLPQNREQERERIHNRNRETQLYSR